MKMIKAALLILSTGLVVFSCTSNVNKSETKSDVQTDIAESTPPPSPKPEIYLYLVTVDNLLLRDQPTQKGSKVVGKFKSGEIVQGAGETSPNQEEATIRGIPITAPFIKVTSTTPEEETGWVFSGAVQVVYAGSRATSPDLGKLVQLSTFLKSLNTKQMSSGQKAWDYVKENFADAKGTLADAAFIMLDNFLHRMEVDNEYFYKETEKMQWTEADQTAIYEDKFDNGKYPLTQSIAANGFRLQMAEGSIFAASDLRDFENFFSPNVTPAMKSYLHQIRLEQDKTAFEDGGIVITIEELADRAAFWEKFNLAHPYFVLNETTQQSQKWTIQALFNGANNTPAFDYETNQPTEDFKKGWDYAARQYGSIQVGKSAKAMLELLTAEGNKKTAKVEEFQKGFQ